LELGQFTVRNHSGVRVRGGRGFRDEFSAFHALAYPELAAQTLAITGDARITRAATATTLSRVWRSWPSVRKTADVLVRARWTAVLVAAERESTTPPAAGATVEAAVEELTGAAAATADTVVVAALQRLPRVQRRALVLHYMSGVSVRQLSELSGSSAEHIELLLDDGFTALADSLEWSGSDDVGSGAANGPDLSFDWASEALTDAAARLPEQIPAPPPTVLLRNATAVRWSVRAIPVAAAAACAAVIAAVAQPEPPAPHMPAAYAAPAADAGSGALAPADRPDPGPEPVGDGGPHPAPNVRMRSIALTSLLDAPGHGPGADDVGSPPDTRDSRVGRAPRTPPGSSSDARAAQAQRADGGRPVGGSERPSTAEPAAGPPAAPPAANAKKAPSGLVALSNPTVDSGAPADLQGRQAATDGGATRMAASVPVQDDALPLPTVPSSVQAETALRPVGTAPALTKPRSIDHPPAEPQAAHPTARLSPIGEKRGPNRAGRQDLPRRTSTATATPTAEAAVAARPPTTEATSSLRNSRSIR
jgi:RNA polymerase sigma-70 factor, ECF subfamily